ncbi:MULTISPECIES: DUF3566 domain-containing protein [Corynebacterium]|uniref:DUF3566 domain-containing protein n=2 Tax=Corynebacterium TaxID=1716 RepID=A0A3G6IRL2_9CORY|nr:MULTISPECIES: DUF3566 domain-containing protein [Corynebacterium]AZA08167.1 hypothetical protein CPPEL_00065 [Corynebacterium pseudopelargi]QAU51320.1 hypothetical protein CPELA_00065 [Corynebacterium pelargi]GGG81759.1 membrane protein [Corynebacterium pelargi]
MAIKRSNIVRVSPKSAVLTALALSLVGFAAWIVCVCLLYFGLDAAGVWDKANSVIGGVGGKQGITFGLVITTSAMLGAVVAVLNILLAPVAAIIYNASVDIFGGLRVYVRETVD